LYTFFDYKYKIEFFTYFLSSFDLDSKFMATTESYYEGADWSK